MSKALTKAEMERLGSQFDKRMDETDAEWEKAKKSGGICTVGELGCSSLADASKKLLEMRSGGKRLARKMYSFRLPVLLVEELKRKAKTEHKPYQKIVNEALWSAV